MLGFAPDETANDLKLLVDEKIEPWIKICQQNHKRCNTIPSSSKKLPTRVIDVGRGNQNPRLCVPAEDGETSSRYLILSYCWGAGNASARTTRANFNTRRRDINYKELPKTIQDAIDLTRALGERFLWVDAVCIIQPDGGDDADWRDQAPLMWHYYRDAICTIAAARAFDSSQGFLSERLGQRYNVQTCELEPWENPDDPIEGKRTVHVHPTSGQRFYFGPTVSHSPLSKRGWVLQEYALSSRVLHWTEHELLWECAEICSSERTSNPKGMDSEAIGYRQKHMKLGSMLGGARNEILGREWNSFVATYTALNLTFESDRLMALMGIAARTKEHFNDEYIFGLWKSQLLLGLAWQAAHRRPFNPSNQCNAPSWSWASCHGVVVKYQMDDVYQSDFEVELVRVDCETDVARKANSECRLVLRGILEKRRFNARKSVAPHGVITNRLLEKAEFRGGGQSIVFDSPDEIPAHVRLLNEFGSFDCLKLCVEKEVGEDGGVDAESVYLILKKVDASARRFRRIGLARIHSSRDSFESRQRHGLQTEVEII